MTEYYIAAQRGRSEGDWHTTMHRQKLEIREWVSNSITSVQKDNYVIEVYTDEHKK